MLNSVRGGTEALYLASVDGQVLVPIPHTQDAGYADWAPDGRRIVFEAFVGNLTQIFVGAVDGGAPAQITHTVGNSRYPTWSPDGSKIAYWSMDNPDTGVTVIVNADGTNPQRLEATRTPGNHGLAAWSPDGQRLALARGDLYVVGLDGGSPVAITSGMAVANPAWSPDGSRIAFYYSAVGGSGIGIVNPDGTGFRPLTQNSFWDDLPSWSPDGRQITFTSRRTSRLGTFIVQVDGGAVTTVVADDSTINTWPRWNPTAHP